MKNMRLPQCLIQSKVSLAVKQCAPNAAAKFHKRSGPLENPLRLIVISKTRYLAPESQAEPPRLDRGFEMSRYRPYS